MHQRSIDGCDDVEQLRSVANRRLCSSADGHQAIKKPPQKGRLNVLKQVITNGRRRRRHQKRGGVQLC